MGDEQGRASPHDLAQRRVDPLFHLGVDRARGVVEDQYPRGSEDGPRKSDPLALAARQGEAALSDDRVVSPWELRDELVRLRQPTAAASISSNVASGLPYAMFVLTLSEKRKHSSNTTPIWRRNDATVTSRTSCPSMRRAPSSPRKSAAPYWPQSTCRFRSGLREPRSHQAAMRSSRPLSTGGASP